MAIISDGGPAFPSVENHPSFDIPQHYHGMSLRDWLAGKAMAGMLAGVPGGHLRPDKCAYAAYEYADAMLDVRRETEELAQTAAGKRHSELMAERSK